MTEKTIKTSVKRLPSLNIKQNKQKTALPIKKIKCNHKICRAVHLGKLAYESRGQRTWNLNYEYPVVLGRGVLYKISFSFSCGAIYKVYLDCFMSKRNLGNKIFK